MHGCTARDWACPCRPGWRFLRNGRCHRWNTHASSSSQSTTRMAAPKSGPINSKPQRRSGRRHFRPALYTGWISQMTLMSLTKAVGTVLMQLPVPFVLPTLTPRRPTLDQRAVLPPGLTAAAIAQSVRCDPPEPDQALRPGGRNRPSKTASTGSPSAQG